MKWSLILLLLPLFLNRESSAYYPPIANQRGQLSARVLRLYLLEAYDFSEIIETHSEESHFFFWSPPYAPVDSLVVYAFDCVFFLLLLSLLSFKFFMRRYIYIEQSKGERQDVGEEKHVLHSESSLCVCGYISIYIYTAEGAITSSGPSLLCALFVDVLYYLFASLSLSCLRSSVCRHRSFCSIFLKFYLEGEIFFILFYGDQTTFQHSLRGWNE